MVEVNLMGGLGNLMFQYALGRAISIEVNEELVLNPYAMIYAHLGVEPKYYFNNGLKNLNIPSEIKSMNKIYGHIEGARRIAQFFILRHKMGGKLLHGKESFHVMNKKGLLYTDDAYSFYEHENLPRKKKIIVGYYNAPKYFDNVSDILSKELMVKTPPSASNLCVQRELESCNSVCVHIRRGDYVSNPKNDYFVICNENYYLEGMRYIAAHTDNPVFYIFSDNNEEIDWIQSHYRFDYPVHYITLNNPDYEELRLMYSCKHFVISNSTFSWWGSFLSSNSDKIIVAPSIWSKSYNASQDIYSKNMVRIDSGSKGGKVT